MTKVIAIMAGKGGVSKSTIAAFTSTILSRRGHDVLLVDVDPQGTTATTWAALRGEHPVEVSVRKMPITQFDQALAKIKDGSLVDFVVVDTPPHSTAALAAVARAADLIIVPCRPNRPDIEGLAPTIDLLKLVPGGIQKARSVMTMTHTHFSGKLAAQKAADVVKKRYDLSSLGRIGNRVAIGYAMDSGLDIAELAPADKGTREFNSLVNGAMRALGLEVK
jgi:chromosome partitioning protein